MFDIVKVFELIGYLTKETKHTPWIVSIKHIKFILSMLEETNVYGKFNDYVIQFIYPIYKSLGWNESPNDSWLDRLLRSRILSFACEIEIKECVDTSKDLYVKWMQSKDRNK